jgi:benzoyl-CoA-dihydrodiol lyase
VLSPLERTDDDADYHYQYVDVAIDAGKSVATLTVTAPAGPVSSAVEDILVAGARWWPLQMARELDDAILTLRTNHTNVGLWIVKTRGDAQAVLATDAALLANQQHWFAREVLGMVRRTFARLEVSSRSIYALVEPRLTLSDISFGSLPAVNGLSRLESRFYQDAAAIATLRGQIGMPLDAREAERLGLVTAAPDDLDWDDEVRVAIEARVALSPDALTGLEANLRFGPRETMASRIFGRLSAWQNWIFIRPNAVGPSGSLKVYGTGQRAQFDQERV